MKKNYVIFGSALLFLSSLCYSQISVPKNLREKKTGVTCGTAVPDDIWNNWFNEKVEEYKKNHANQKSNSSNFTIPVIVHVIHSGQSVGTFPNISQAQVNSQITALNNDFGGTGYNVGQLASTGFSAIGAANCNITFCLAQKDPNGNFLPEPGIDRINRVSKGWNDLNTYNSATVMVNYIDNTIKPASIWDPKFYMNIWVADASGTSLLGFSTFPAGSGLTGLPSGFGTATTDGVFCIADYFGTTGAVTFPNDKGRIMTHETGHWLGLRHIWGDAVCGTDYCNDTPIQEQPSQFCPIYPNISMACSNGPYGDMFMNFMDYNDQDCMYMFTPDQNTRIQTALQNGTFRNQLSASAATLCSLPPSAPVASITVPNNACKDSVVAIINQSTGNPAPNYSWSATPSSGFSFTPSASSPNASFVCSSNGTYTVTLVVSNASGSSTVSSSVLVSGCFDTGISQNEQFKKSISILPNPSSGKLEVKVGLPPEQNIILTVKNSLGQVILSDTFKSDKNHIHPLNLSNQPAGVYFISIGTENNQMVKRIMITD